MTAPAAKPGPAVTLNQGIVIDDRWRIAEKIGEGGMGSVYRAEDLRDRRPVAIKMLAEHLCKQREYVERFQREVAVMQKVRHPNVIFLYAVGEWSGRPFLVMPMLRGKALKAFIDPWIAPAQALKFFEQMCRGTGALHEQGIIHRDLKPANMFVDEETGRLTLLDLGIARASNSTLTKTGIVFGTAAYLSPEQIVGEKSIDARSDVYSLGVVFFEMLSGQTPYQGRDQHQLMLAHLTHAPPDITAVVPDVPMSLRLVMEKALAKSPDDRYASTMELYAAVAGCFRAATNPEQATSASVVSGATEPATVPTGPGMIPPDALAAARAAIRKGKNKEAAVALPMAFDAGSKDQPTSVAAAIPAGPRSQERRYGLMPTWRRMLPFAIGGVVALALGITVLIVTREPPPAPLQPLPIVGTSEDSTPVLIAESPTLTGAEQRASQFKVATVKEDPPRPKVNADGSYAPKHLKRFTSVTSAPKLLAISSGQLFIMVTVAGEPLPAKVSIDGKFVGDAPLDTRLLEGEHLFVIQHKGFPTTRFTSNITKGTVHRMEIDLWPQGAAPP